MKKKMALTAIGLGAAYLMRNKESRDKLVKQFDEFSNTPMRGDKEDDSANPSEQRNKGLLGRFLD